MIEEQYTLIEHRLFPEVQIFPNGEPLALAEIFPIQKFPNLVP